MKCKNGLFYPIRQINQSPKKSECIKWTFKSFPNLDKRGNGHVVEPTVEGPGILSNTARIDLAKFCPGKSLNGMTPSVTIIK
eukprot:1946943-Amphidinium_carterae.1